MVERMWGKQRFLIRNNGEQHEHRPSRERGQSGVFDLYGGLGGLHFPGDCKG